MRLIDGFTQAPRTHSCAAGSDAEPLSQQRERILCLLPGATIPTASHYVAL